MSAFLSESIIWFLRPLTKGFRFLITFLKYGIVLQHSQFCLFKLVTQKLRQLEHFDFTHHTCKSNEVIAKLHDLQIIGIIKTLMRQQ